MLFTTCSQANKFLVALSSKTHDQFLHRHEERAHRVRQEQLQMLSQQCSPLAPGSICAFLQAQQALFAPTRLRVFSSEFLFFQVREFFISHLMLSSNVWNPYPFLELFMFSEIFKNSVRNFDLLIFHNIIVLYFRNFVKHSKAFHKDF